MNKTIQIKWLFLYSYFWNVVCYLQFEYRSQIEALKLKKIEEKELKDAGNKRAKEIAEQKYRVSEKYWSVYYTVLHLTFKKYGSFISEAMGI